MIRRTFHASRWVWRVAAITIAASGCGDDASVRAKHDATGGAPTRVVVAYVSADEAVARPILDAFTAETGIEVRARFDGEAAKTTALAAMLRAERDAPRADVFWSSEGIAAAQLAREGVLAPWRSRTADALPERLRGEAGRWYGFAPRMRVLVFDPLRTPMASLPTTMLALAAPSTTGRVAIADPRFGTTRGHVAAFAAMLERTNPGAYAAWVEELAAKSPLIVAGGNAAVVDAVLRGEAAFGLTDSDDFFAARCAGGSLGAIAIRQFAQGSEGGGPMLTPNTVSLVSGAPHPTEASELMDFLLSRRVGRWLHESRSGNFLVDESTGPQDGSVSRDPLPAGLPPIDPSCEPLLGRVQLERAGDPFVADEFAVIEWVDRAAIALRSACGSKASP